ncbi:MAG TPA: ABC transporter permease [Vicinamibacterales bacterium]|nr:ABC transporter permease [Vicinamibacterales bacterium]
MARFVLWRSVQAVPLLLGISLIAFVLLQAIPGDPTTAYYGTASVTAKDLERLRDELGLDEPIVVQYVAWLEKFVQGDWGVSYVASRPVLGMILERLPATLELILSAMALSLVVAVPAGVAAARRPGSAIDRLARGASLLGISAPPFWIGIMLILVFAVELNWFPAGGIETVGASGFMDRLRHLVLPVTCLTLLNLASVARLMRAETIAAMRQDYVRTARAKGLPEGRVIWGHAMRNALNPVVTVIALEFGTLFSGALITETVFAYPGMGKMIYDAILGNDYNLALVGLLFATLLVLVGNLAADIGYAVLDPRISYK